MDKKKIEDGFKLILEGLNLDIHDEHFKESLG